MIGDRRYNNKMNASAPATDRDPAVVRSMFGQVARRYDLANHLLSGGLDFWWRRRAAKIVGNGGRGGCSISRRGAVISP